MKKIRVFNQLVNLNSVTRNVSFLFALTFLLISCDDLTKKPNPTTDKSTEMEEKKPPIVRTNKTYTKDELIGKVNPATDADFTKIESKYTTKSNIYLRKDAYIAFKEMHAAALKDGINLKIVSAARPFNHQKSIWEAKWTGARKVGGKDLSQAMPNGKDRALEILKFSSMPGTSRHHWGTDIDLNNLENSWFETGEGLKIYKWLQDNALVYGYCQTYTPKGADRPHGYEEEKWHWSYLPISMDMVQQYQKFLKDTDIAGFKGSETATEIGIVEKYVLGINPSCE